MKKHLRIAATYVALVAMMLCALMPAGWMPNAGGSTDGRLITVCTMYGPVQISLGPNGESVKQRHHQDNDRSHEICPFAGVPHFAAPVAFAATVAPALVVAGTGLSAIRPIASARLPYSDSSPCAPPSFA